MKGSYPLVFISRVDSDIKSVRVGSLVFIYSFLFEDAPFLYNINSFRSELYDRDRTEVINLNRSYRSTHYGALPDIEDLKLLTSGSFVYEQGVIVVPS